MCRCRLSDEIFLIGLKIEPADNTLPCNIRMKIRYLNGQFLIYGIQIYTFSRKLNKLILFLKDQEKVNTGLNADALLCLKVILILSSYFNGTDVKLYSMRLSKSGMSVIAVVPDFGIFWILCFYSKKVNEDWESAVNPLYSPNRMIKIILPTPL